jgi:AcrR family transcriptional regulator
MQPKTSRGRRMRRRILETAAQLIHTRGVEATSLDLVLSESGAGKGQFYHYFGSKGELVEAVLRHQMERAVFDEMPAIRQLDTWTGIRAWFDRLMTLQEERAFVGGCPVGSMAAEMVDRDAHLREQLAEAFRIKRSHLEKGLTTMLERGELRDGTDTAALALFVEAAIQGATLLSTTEKSLAPMRVALDSAYAHVRSFAR